MIAQRIRNCQECVSLELLDDAKKMIEAGETVFNLAIEEPQYFDCQDENDAEIDAENDQEFHLFLEEKISEKLRIENSLDYPKEEIILTNGIQSSLSLILYTILNPFDEVIIPVPYAKGYPEMVKLAGGKPILVKLGARDQYKLTPKILLTAITPKTRAIIFNNPVNSTGLIYSIDELLALSEIIVKKKIMLISDETDEPFITEGKNYIAIASLNPQIKNLTILINDFSAYTQKGDCDISYIAANKTIVGGIKKIQHYMVSGPSECAKKSARRALRFRNQRMNIKMALLNKQRKEMFFYLNQIKKVAYIESQGIFYVLVDISEVLKTKQNAINSETSLGFSKALLKRSKTLVMPGEVFGMPGSIRLCFAVNALEKGIKNLIEFIEKY